MTLLRTDCWCRGWVNGRSGSVLSRVNLSIKEANGNILGRIEAEDRIEIDE